uniref:Uncharacterized protein n=1 Tax=Rhizophagus irregularis (strain DAOM 181602 / DAOM 197198 / MUCL 43194) TaxID=747089 RepID=U9UQZ8_RHIID
MYDDILSGLTGIYNYRQYRDESFREALENSLIKHADTIQYFKITKQPTTKILSSFINLRILELYNNNHGACNCLEDISLPSLQILRVKHVPIKFLISLIENTSGHLVEIKSLKLFFDNWKVGFDYILSINIK